MEQLALRAQGCLSTAVTCIAIELCSGWMKHQPIEEALKAESDGILVAQISIRHTSFWPSYRAENSAAIAVKSICGRECWRVRQSVRQSGVAWLSG